MTQLTSAQLMQAQRFLLEIHAAREVDALRRLVSEGLSRMIACDRAAFNECSLSGETPPVPHPVPVYWQRLGPIMAHHQHEHRLLDPAAKPPLHTTMTFGDWKHDPRWRKSTLYHDYYRVVGARQQVGVSVFQSDSTRIVLNCNRSSRDFSRSDRAVMELLSPHVACAWRNAVELLTLRRQRLAPEADVRGRRHLLNIDSSARIVAPVAPGARELLRVYCGADVDAGSHVPEPIGRWLNALDRVLESADKALSRPPPPLVMARASVALVVRRVQSSPAGVVILLEETCFGPRAPAPGPVGELTCREAEILRWVGEGKRNSEIGMILGVSSRTVGKHLEHIFAKLRVETRAAAVHAAAPWEKPAHG